MDSGSTADEAQLQPAAAEEVPEAPEEPAALGAESIRIYLRSRPIEEPTDNIEYDPHDSQLTVRVPKDASSGCAAAHVFPCQHHASMHHGQFAADAGM